MEELKFIVDEQDVKSRLDVFCTKHCEKQSRAYLKKLIQNGNVTVDGASKKESYKVKTGESIVIHLPAPKTLEVAPENIPLDIVYEDGDVIVVNKPSGMVVHPAPGSPDGTLVNALLYHTKDLSGINGVLRPGIVHRIDKDTSGLLVVAKNDRAHAFLSEQLSRHAMLREYRAIVKGNISEDTGTVDMPLGRDPKNRIKMAVAQNGKPAVTHFKVVRRYGDYTQMTFRLETGRTHQIRVHMKTIGHPIAGDPLYGGDKNNPFATDGQMLHAQVLGFVHPITKKKLRFEVKPPQLFERALNFLEHQITN